MPVTATVLSIVRVVHQFDFDTTQIATRGNERQW